MFNRKSLTPQDVLQFLPIPPQYTMWKIWAGRKYTGHISSRSTPEEHPFVIGLLQENDYTHDVVLMQLGVNRITKSTVKNAARLVLESFYFRFPSAIPTQELTGKLADGLSLTGYYVAEKENHEIK